MLMFSSGVAFLLSLLSVFTAGQQCTDQDFSISYNGNTVFTVSSANASCSCRAYNSPGESNLRNLTVGTLSVDNVLTAASVRGDGAGLSNLAANPTIAAQAQQIAQLTALVANLTAQLAAAGGAGGGSGGCRTADDCPSRTYCSSFTGTCKLGPGAACAAASQCIEGLNCSNAVCSAPLASCWDVLGAGRSLGDGNYLVNPALVPWTPTLSPNPGVAMFVHCDMTLDGGGWTMVLNVNTMDGNVVQYENADFWTSPTALGGASRDPGLAYVRDHKQPFIFATVPATHLLIKVHRDGAPLYWRSWMMASRTTSMMSYLNGGLGSNRRVTSGVRASGTIVPSATAMAVDPVICPDVAPLGADLFATTCTGSTDYNRVSCLHSTFSSCGPYNNRGWGLGTSYDQGSPTCSRPCADAQSVGGAGANWGGGLIGNDVNPLNEYGTNPYGHTHSYAIFVRWYDQWLPTPCTSNAQCTYGGWLCSTASGVCKKPPGVACANTTECFDGLTCTAGKVCSAPLQSCEQVKSTLGVTASGTYMINPTGLATWNGGSVSTMTVYCDMSTDGGGWMQVLGVDTDDGNLLYYDNSDYWAHATNLGGATSDVYLVDTRDYKNAPLFASFWAKHLLIQVKLNGIVQSWTSHAMRFTSQPLLHYFTATGRNGNYLVTSSIRSISTASTVDPVVVNVAGHNLYANTLTGGDDINRLGWSVGAPAIVDNQGYGLGTFYDHQQGFCSRPCADAVNKGSYANIWQYVGTDVNPSRQYGSSSGVAFTYAIYVR